MTLMTTAGIAVTAATAANRPTCTGDEGWQVPPSRVSKQSGAGKEF